MGMRNKGPEQGSKQDPKQGPQQMDLDFGPGLVDSEIPEKTSYFDYTDEERKEFTKLLREAGKKKLSPKMERFRKMYSKLWDTPDDQPSWNRH